MIEIVDVAYPTGWVAGQIRFPKSSMTFVVKGTYALHHGGPCVPAKDQLPIIPDAYETEDDPNTALAYPNDLAWFKSHTDIVLKATAYAPNGNAVEDLLVGIQVAGLKKDIRIVGDRTAWVGPDLFTTSRPTPFTTMPLTWDRAFGGLGYSENPAGRGFLAETPDQNTEVSLPNLEVPGLPLKRLNSYQSVAVGPISPMWPQRQHLLGTFDDKFVAERWPWLPEDMDWRCFNAAPDDQQFEGYLNGDEELRFWNLHPEHPEFVCKLPGVRIRCFFADVINSPISFSEVPMALDTLYADIDSQQLVLVWRGNIDLRKAEPGPDDCVMYVAEPLNDEPQSIDFYEDRLHARLVALSSESEPAELNAEELTDSEEELPSIPVESVIGDDWDDTDVPQLEPLSREECLKRLAEGGNFDDLDLSGVDLRDLSMERVSFKRAILTDAHFRRSQLSEAVFTGAVLENTDFSFANLNSAKLDNADCTNARFVDTDLRNAVLSASDFTGSDFTEAHMEEMHAADTSFHRCCFYRVSAQKSNCERAVFTRCELSDANFTEANLSEASMEEALAYPLIAPRSIMKQLCASDAVFWSSNFTDADAAHSVWDRADIRLANFTGADLSGAQFASSKLQGTNLQSARLRSARLQSAILRYADMTGADLYESSLERADISFATLSEANLFDVDFTGCLREETVMREADVKRSPTLRQ